MDEDERQSRIDFHDLQGELSGASNKAARFFDPDRSPRSPNGERRFSSDKLLQTQLHLMMLNPSYAAAYERLSDLIDYTQEKLNTAIDQVAGRIEHLEELLADLEQNTAMLPDGTAVFRSTDGSLRTAEGKELTATETALLLNANNLLSLERYQYAQTALKAARSKQDDLSKKQDVLDDAHSRMDDSDNPALGDELDDIEGDVTRVLEELEAANALRPKFQGAVSPNADDLLADLNFVDGRSPTQPGGQAR